jgi:hypothetical protein
MFVDLVGRQDRGVVSDGTEDRAHLVLDNTVRHLGAVAEGRQE